MSEPQPGGSVLDCIDFEAFVPQVGVFCCYVATVLLAVAITPGFEAAGLPHIEGGGTPGHLGRFFVVILASTAAVLLVDELGFGQHLLKLGYYAISAYVLALFAGTFVGGLTVPALAVGVVCAAALWAHHEWYVLDAFAVAFGATAATQLGLGLAPGLVVAFLVVMLAYDAFAVYRSEHMQSLAGAVGDLDLPMFSVVPADPRFSLRTEDPTDTDATVSLLGLGDALFPAMLVVSVTQFLDAPAVLTLADLPLGLPALGALAGAVCGLLLVNVVLHYWERMHPALPYINTLTVAGYLLGVLAAGVPLATALAY